MRRLFSVLAVLALVGAAALFASGGTEGTAAAGPSGNFSPSGYPVVKDKVTINVLYSKSPTMGDWNEILYIKEIEKLTNLELNCIAVADTAWEEKKNLAFASGDLPDLFWSGISIKNEFDYGVVGKVLQPYNDLIEKYGPNFKKTMVTYPDVKGKISAPDGKIYQLPYIPDTLTIADTTLYVRMDWLKQAGMQKPTTVAEFYNVLKAFQKLDPSYIPFGMWWDTLKATLVPSFGPYVENWYDKDASGKVVVVPATDQYREMLKFLNKLFAEKLLDNETFTQKSENLIAKVKENRVGFTSYGTLLLPSNFKSGNYEIEICVPLTSEFAPTPKNRTYPGKVAMGYAGLTSKNKYPEATMRWLDINYSDEDVAPGLNCLSFWLGIRGVSWDYTTPDKSTYKRIIPADTKYSEVEYMTQKVSTSTAPGKLPFMAMPEVATSASQVMKATQSVKYWFPYNKPAFPIAYMRYTKEEQDRVNTLRTDLETYVKQMEAKFVSGTEPLANWDAYIANLKKIGIDEFTKILQAAYDRYLKNF
jgi:putative aldouronate transport system substrate-binding protein